MTATVPASVTVQADPLRAFLTEAARQQHLHREQLERQQRTPGQAAWQVESTARDIRDTTAVLHFLAKSLREIPKAGAR